MKRKTPVKIAVMRIRIAQRDTAKKSAEKERTKCHACNGKGYIAGGENTVGCCTCIHCNGTGRYREISGALSLLKINL